MTFLVDSWHLLYIIVTFCLLSVICHHFDQSLLVDQIPETNLHMIIKMKSLWQNCRPLSCEMSLVARSEERLRHTVNYLKRLYFNKIFKKRKRKIMVEELMWSQKEKDHINDVKEGSTTG